MQTGNENTQTYQVEVVLLISYQILITNLHGNDCVAARGETSHPDLGSLRVNKNILAHTKTSDNISRQRGRICTPKYRNCFRKK